MKTIKELKQLKKQLNNTIETAPTKDGILALDRLNIVNKEIRLIQLKNLIDKYTEKRAKCRNMNDFKKYTKLIDKYEKEFKRV